MSVLTRFRGQLWYRGLALLALLVAVPSAWSAGDLRVTSIRVTNNDVRITWDAPPGSNYVVQAATPLRPSGFNSFSDISGPITVVGPGLQSTNYTHLGGMLGATSRFYRVRSFPIPVTVRSLFIYPTNATIGLNMVTRYSVFALYSDNSMVDVTASATMTSLNGVAQVMGLTNGFALVRGNAFGTGTVRASYQGASNTVNLAVSQITRLFFDPPLSPIQDYVAGGKHTVVIMATFSNGQTVNVTPASTLDDSGAAFATRVEYRVQADVANSYALITGQSAANGDVVFTVPGGYQTDFLPVTWCKYTSISFSPPSAQICVGATQPFSVIGHVADGTSEIVLNGLGSFDSDDPTIAQTFAGPRRATGLAPGRTTIRISFFNGAGCDPDLQASADITVLGGQVYYESTFEGGLEGCTINNNILAGGGLWHRSTGRGLQTGHSSANSLYYGRSEGPNGGGNFDAGNTAGFFFTRAINLAGVPPPISLNFNYLLATENFMNFDAAAVLIFTNSTDYATVAGNKVANVQLFDSPTANTWTNALVDLSGFAGRRIQVAFIFQTVDDRTNQFEGWYVDDIRVTGPISSANDNFTNRFTLSGPSTTTCGSNVGATKEAGETNHVGNIGGKSVWWSWTAPNNGLVTISTCGSTFDTLLAVYTGTSVNALTPVASNDNFACPSGASLQSQVQFTATAGTTYQIAVDGSNSGAGAQSGSILLSIQQ